MTRKPEQIISDQVHFWEHLRKTEMRGATPPPFWHSITVSRAFGANGSALAAELAHRTGFSVWDKELVQAIAEVSGADERILRTLDEHRRRAIDDFVHTALQHGRHSNLKYLRSLMRVVHALAEHGSSIIVGRGANFICKPGAVLRLRVVAPLDERVRRYAAEHSVPDREARRAVEQQDAEREDFVRYHFRRDSADPTEYDLVLNAAVFDLDRMAELALEAYAARFGARPPAPSDAPRVTAATA